MNYDIHLFISYYEILHIMKKKPRAYDSVNPDLGLVYPNFYQISMKHFLHTSNTNFNLKSIRKKQLVLLFLTKYS